MQTGVLVNEQLCTRTKIAESMSKVVDDKIIQCHGFIIGNRSKYNNRLACVGNMYKTPMTFDMPFNVKYIGEKTIPVKTTGHKKAD